MQGLYHYLNKNATDILKFANLFIFLYIMYIIFIIEIILLLQS